MNVPHVCFGLSGCLSRGKSPRVRDSGLMEATAELSVKNAGVIFSQKSSQTVGRCPPACPSPGSHCFLLDIPFRMAALLGRELLRRGTVLLSVVLAAPKSEPGGHASAHWEPEERSPPLWGQCDSTGKCIKRSCGWSCARFSSADRSGRPVLLNFTKGATLRHFFPVSFSPLPLNVNTTDVTICCPSEGHNHFNT